jgi:hypothetical protein
MFVLNWLLWPYQPTVRTEAASSLGSILFDTSSVWIVLLELLPMSSIAVAWHRRLLLEEPVKSWSYFRLDRLVGIFALTNLLIALPELIPTLGLGLTASQDRFKSNRRHDS